MKKLNLCPYYKIQLVWAVLRPEAMELINDISTNSDILVSATHINLQLGEQEQTRIIIHSQLNCDQKELLGHFVSKRNLKLVECPHDVWMIY